MRNPLFWLTSVLLTLCLSVGLALAQELPPTNVTVLVNRDGVNVRLLPALGAEVIGNVNAGYTALVYARSPDNEWVRVRFSGEEGWIGTAVLTVLSGDLNSAPVADPRTIPYGGFDSPRAGTTSASSPIQGRLDDSGVRVRAGPSRAYPVLANAPRRTQFSILGRTYNNAWYQVNFEGTLGWVTARGVTLLGAVDITTLPVDGIVAESLPLSQPTADDYLATLRLLRDRVEFAQPSLDAIRAIWTNIALGGRATCGSYPARPSDYNIPNPLLAAFFQTLDPLQRDFNAAMANVRTAIDILIDVCSRPQPAEGSVGQAVAQNALVFINDADAQFASLRQRLNELIPPDRQPGANECLFTFQAQSAILPLIEQNRIYVDHFNERRTITGYCFDASAGQILTISGLKLSGNIGLFIAISPFDNPTNFLAVGRMVADQPLLSIGPISIPANGRYLIIVNNIGGEGAPLEGGVLGDFAVLVNSGGAVDPNQAIDLATGGSAAGYNLAGIVPLAQATPSFLQPTVVVPGTVIAPATFCPGLNLTCSQLTCEQAVACLQAGNFTLDPDADRIPCEENGCTLAG